MRKQLCCFFNSYRNASLLPECFGLGRLRLLGAEKKVNRIALILLFILGIVAVSGLTLSSPIREDIWDRKGPPKSAADDLNSKVAKSPEGFQNGTASLDQIKVWFAREFPGEPRRWVIEEPDLDLDGTPDLLVADDQFTGTGGRNYEAFLRTRLGFRYIGELGSEIRPVPAVGGHARIVMAGHMSAGEAGVALAEIRQDGLHRLASAAIAAGDQGTAEGNHIFEKLMRAHTVSLDILRLVFGPEAYPTPDRTGRSER